MKPLKLELSAFGPYPGRLVLDFGELQNHSLFLIHGDTGSGKTSILDAMCYALYGKCSGRHRDEKFVRSHHATRDAHTEVIFDFRLGSKYYRVHRRPKLDLQVENERPEGARENAYGAEPVRKPRTKRSVANAIAIYSLSESPDGCNFTVAAVKEKQITATVTALLKLSVEQFRQTIMLPQGEFLRFLQADSKDRLELLDKLFQTDDYGKIELALKEQKSALGRELEIVNISRKALLTQAQVETEEELVEKTVRLAANLETIRADSANKRKASDSAQLLVNHAKLIQEKFVEHGNATQELERISRGIEGINWKRTETVAARKAITPTHKEHALDERTKEFIQAESVAKAAEKAHARAREAMTGAEMRLKKAQEEHGLLDELRQAAHQIDQVLRKFDELAESEIRLKKADQSAESAKQGAEKLALRIKKLQADMDKMSAELVSAQEKSAQQAFLELLVNELTKSFSAARELAARRLEAKKTARIEKELTTQLAALTLEYERLGRECSEIEARFFTGQAALLAGNLAENMPCPVCGSLDHPRPAECADAVPDESAVKAARDEWETARTRLNKVEKELANRNAQGAALAGAIESLTQQIADRSEWPLDRFKKEIDGAGEALEHAAQASRQAVVRQKTITKAQDELARVSTEHTNAVETLAAATEAQQRCKGEHGAILKEIPDTTKSRQDALQQKAACDKRIRTITVEHDAALNARATASEAATATLTAAAGAGESLRQAEGRMKVAADEFECAMRAAGFGDVTDFRSAKRTEAYIDEIEEEIKRFEAALEAAGDRAHRAEKGISGLEKPDMEVIQETARTAASLLEKSIREETETAQDLKVTTERRREYAELSSQHQEIERRYRISAGLSDTANGINDKRITFQTFVLASILEDVLNAATQRLEIMSHGRYLLTRGREVMDRRSASGLDVHVHDTYTETPRPVTTLSGGESFLASLALALGLSDTVRSYAGGIHLDTIFIDEGFGSLDPESLDLAYRALVDLQKGGRLVGLISHVGDLKERIPARLEVTKGRNGSSASFVVGTMGTCS